MSYAYYGHSNLGSIYAGATITATVVDVAGVALGVQPTRDVVALGGGVFGLHVPDMPDGHAGWVVLKEGATVLDALLVAPVEVEPAAISVLGSVDDASPGASDFAGDAGLSATDDFYNGSVLAFTSGSLKGVARRIADYAGSSRSLTFAVAFPAAPADGDAFAIFGRIDT